METTKILTILSKEVKLKLLIHLFSCVDNECEVNTFVEIFQEKQANISKHLNDLKKANLVGSRKVSTSVYYYMLDEAKQKYGKLLEEIMNLEALEKLTCKCNLK
ncbi:ArsR/SmtB family transcription factor [Mycoplasmopsis glycophila]|uniref:Predicted ArsR-family transcription repressor n=1 Tax=Mycoplasmopsis glycophila TaxID=171285 RepID=A0A449AV49_9BACT|nr:ArsR family transcriptional regulator [Mycoplasmopsis glycophila]VEU70366.1 predicted ArsR-family transcription repressor [Mycoplasmopsis glycophila]